MKARHVMGAIALIALAGCSSPDPAPAPAPAPEAVAQPEVGATPGSAPGQAGPACAEVFVPDKPVDEAKAIAGCLSPGGRVVVVKFVECKDGSALYQADSSTGAPNGYAFGGEAYRVVKGEIAADDGYKKAYQTCTG